MDAATSSAAASYLADKVPLKGRLGPRLGSLRNKHDNLGLTVRLLIQVPAVMVHVLLLLRPLLVGGDLDATTAAPAHALCMRWYGWHVSRDHTQVPASWHCQLLHQQLRAKMLLLLLLASDSSGHTMAAATTCHGARRLAV